jgi:hypothetical protein
MSKWDDMYRCPKCRPHSSGDAPRCANCRDADGKRVKHSERIEDVDLAGPATVRYLIVCECGAAWPVFVATELEIARDIVEARGRT